MNVLNDRKGKEGMKGGMNGMEWNGMETWNEWFFSQQGCTNGIDLTHFVQRLTYISANLSFFFRSAQMRNLT